MLTKLTKKPIRRRLGLLVVTMDADGVTLRGFRRRNRKRILRVTWAQVASLARPEHPAIRFAENVDGKRQLEAMGAAGDDGEKDPTGSQDRQDGADHESKHPLDAGNK